ncbi:ABC transporter substrate-binding protein [Gordonibacter sp. 28C]|uniref:ABC transporter substrate-binding protein n=1 Tax=Gordonibacter sp. 28C TaxID=2078569 RepID=UPI001F543DB9|nr:ABC transporter substrate-binding protein [Gordonibacter sp. 28C]
MRTTRTGVWRKRIATVACAAVLCCGLAALAGCSGGDQKEESKAPEQTQTDQAATRTFTDSAGREVEVPAQIDKIAPSGHTAMQVLLTMAPDKLVGLSQELTADQLKYFDSKLADLPVFGAAFGAKGDMNKESVAAAGPQVVIDTGEYKDGLKEDLDNLQSQLGIPVVFIETPLDGYDKSYEMLGDLLGMEDRGKELGDYCKNAYDEVETVMAAIPESERVNVAYLMGDSGLNAIAKTSYQGTVIDMCANNVVQLEKASASGAGNEISLEQIAVWNPDLIVFGTKSIYDTVGDDAAWAGISAVESKNYYEVPSEPWCWLNNPPTVNQIMGLQWFPRLCYPDKFDNDLQDVVTSYYKTFYDYDLSQADYDELMSKALPR